MKLKTYLFVFLGLIILVLGYLLYGVKNGKMSPELSIYSNSLFGKDSGKAVAASCGMVIHGSADEFTSCEYSANCCYGGPVRTTGTSQCGGACSGGTPACANHPNFGKPCTSEPNACGVIGQGTYDRCGICQTNIPPLVTCNKTNVCGQVYSGFQCPTGCTANSPSGNINDSCIGNFSVTNTNVNVNGSVEFSWTLPTNVKSLCGFVDLTTPTPRPIPGLQNLDTTLDRVRISNIQLTTRFCLVCQFYSLTNNTLLGNGAQHQWIRVIRIGEN